jgi:type IV secretion system protein VirB9
VSACTLSAAALLPAGAPAAGASTPATTVMADGSLRYVYGHRPQPQLVCVPQHVCDIALDNGESVLNMAIGDAAHWVIAGGQSGPSGTTPHVFVKPAQSALETNIVITTTKRVYDVTLRSAAQTQHSRISFMYVDEDAAARALIAQRAVDGVLAGTPLVAADAADAKYALTGDAALVPQRVFNDGVRTYIAWKTLPGELPAVMSIGKDGVATPVNFRVVGTQYIVDGINPNYDLVLAASTERHGRPERRAAIRHL